MTFYKVSRKGRINNLNTAIYEFQSALADEMNVHNDRVINILDSTNILSTNLTEKQIQNIEDRLDVFFLDYCGKCYKELDDKLISYKEFEEEFMKENKSLWIIYGETLF